MDPNTKGWLFLGGLGALILANNPRVKTWLEEFNEGYPAWVQQRQARPLQAPPSPQPLFEPVGTTLFPWMEQLTDASVQTYSPAVDEPIAQLLHHPSVVLILGHRGSGKTALAARLQELLRDVAPPYAVGLPEKAARLLPDWYGLAQDFDTIPRNAIIYVPESYRLFHARTTQTAQGRMIADLINLSRHRKHTLIFDVQNAAQLDRNIISEVDLVLVKEPGPFQEGFERNQFKGLMNSARAAFARVGTSRKRKALWVVAPSAGIDGQLMENLLPSFWTDSLSRVFEDTPVGMGTGGAPETGATNTVKNVGPKAAPFRKGKRTPVEIKREKAKAMRAAGYSYREIGRALGVSPSYAHKLVNGPVPST